VPPLTYLLCSSINGAIVSTPSAIVLLLRNAPFFFRTCTQPRTISISAYAILSLKCHLPSFSSKTLRCRSTLLKTPPQPAERPLSFSIPFCRVSFFSITFFFFFFPRDHSPPKRDCHDVWAPPCLVTRAFFHFVLIFCVFSTIEPPLFFPFYFSLSGNSEAFFSSSHVFLASMKGAVPLAHRNWSAQSFVRRLSPIPSSQEYELSDSDNMLSAQQSLP